MPQTGRPAAPLFPQLPPCERPCVELAGCDVQAFEDSRTRYRVVMLWMLGSEWDALDPEDRAGWGVQRDGVWVRVRRILKAPRVGSRRLEVVA